MKWECYIHITIHIVSDIVRKKESKVKQHNSEISRNAPLTFCLALLLDFPISETGLSHQWELEEYPSHSKKTPVKEEYS